MPSLSLFSLQLYSYSSCGDASISKEAMSTWQPSQCRPSLASPLRHQLAVEPCGACTDPQTQGRTDYNTDNHLGLPAPRAAAVKELYLAHCGKCRGFFVNFFAAIFPGNWRTKICETFRQNFAAFFADLLQKFRKNFALWDCRHIIIGNRLATPPNGDHFEKTPNISWKKDPKFTETVGKSWSFIKKDANHFMNKDPEIHRTFGNSQRFIRFSGRGWGQQLFSFQSPAVQWMARTSSLNCLSCRNPYQAPHSLTCLPPLHWKALLFLTEKCTDFPKSGSEDLNQGHLAGWHKRQFLQAPLFGWILPFSGVAAWWRWPLTRFKPVRRTCLKRMYRFPSDVESRNNYPFSDVPLTAHPREFSVNLFFAINSWLTDHFLGKTCY